MSLKPRGPLLSQSSRVGAYESSYLVFSDVVLTPLVVAEEVGQSQFPVEGGYGGSLPVCQIVDPARGARGEVT